MQFRTLDPEFAQELAVLLLARQEASLAEQMLLAEIVERCECDEEFCASFDTAPAPIGAYGPGHRNVELNPEDGMVILDVVHGRLMQVEVLWRPDFRRKLRLALPSPDSRA